MTISNKISSTYSIPTVVKRIKAGTTVLRGGSITDGGNVQTDWAEFASRGNNWNRSHHIEYGLDQGRWTVQQIYDSWTGARSYGVVTSMGLCDKLGETTPWGIHGFKDRLITQDPEAEKVFEKYIDSVTPLLKHPGLFMVTLMNEGPGTPEERARFIQKWTPKIRSINPHVMITDAGHMWRAGNEWEWVQKVLPLLDCFDLHMYGAQEMGMDSWVDEWHLKDALWWSARAKELGKPVMVQEYGSWSNNPFYIENELAFNLTAAQEGWSTAQFAYNTGSDTDKYSIKPDPNRLATMLHANMMVKNRDVLVARDGGKIVAMGTRVEMPNRTWCRVGSYVWNTDPKAPAFARITKVLA